MVARCANPTCNCEFRELSKGRLFLLPPVREFGESLSVVTRMIDHCYWLCPDCAETHTLRLDGSTLVVARVRLKEESRPVTHSGRVRRTSCAL